MFRAIVLACLLALVAARSVEQQRLSSFDSDAEIVPGRTGVDAVEVPAGETPAVEENQDGEGRQFVFPRVRIFRIPPLFRTQSPLFPNFFNNRRPAFSSGESDIFADLFPDLGGAGDKRVGAAEEEEAAAGGEPKPSWTDAEFVPPPSETEAVDSTPQRVPSRRPGFMSLGDLFADFNRRMQSFEDDISGLFRTLVRNPERPGIREPSTPDSAVTVTRVGQRPVQDGEEQEEEEEPTFGRPGLGGFGLFRPFRPFGSGLFGFRHPAEFPATFKNSTSKTEVVNGTRVMVNETISKGGDENSSHFFHVKVIHVVPEDGGEETKTPAVDDEQRPVEQKPAEDDGAEEVDVVVPGEPGPVDRDVEQVTDVPREVSSPSPSASSPSSPDTTSSRSEQDDLSSILPEISAADDEQAETEGRPAAVAGGVGDGVNPADFGYHVGDNEIGGKVDVEVVNLPSGKTDGQDAELPWGVDKVPVV